MRQRLSAIVWAQFQITRNHFPRTSFGIVLSWCVSALWYLLFVALALFIMRALQQTPAEYLLPSVATGLLAVFAYMQVVPLVTVSSGWSLQLDKLQAFPISDDTLFLIEVILRLTGAPEMFILLGGGFAGLLLRGDLAAWMPFLLLFFIPFSLFIQLAIRDFILHSFARNRFREVIAVLFMCIAFLPQLLVRQRNITLLKPYLLIVANGRATPWHQIAALAVGQFSIDALGAVICWNVIAGYLAKRQFMKSLRREDSFRNTSVVKSGRKLDLIAALTRHLRDPFGALVDKELRTLVRMPRFRVLFGMACVFSIFVFLPIALQTGEHSFMGRNGVPVTSLYGLLLLSDALLLNIFGFDRAAAQIYFATPPVLSLVIRAKNLAACLLVALQTLAVPLLSLVFRVKMTFLTFLAGLLASAVATVFLLAAGNMISMYFPRPVDPRAPFRKQGGGKIQLWLLGCSFCMFLLVGFAFFSRWATGLEWVLFAVLGLEFVIGFILYRIALESAIERALATAEKIVTDLSKSAAPLS